MSVKKKGNTSFNTKPSLVTAAFDQLIKKTNDATNVRMAIRTTNRKIGEMAVDRNSYAARVSAGALASLTRVMDGSGNFKDWSQLMYRMFAGVFASEMYLEEDQTTVDILDRAIGTLHLIMVRTHCIGADGFGTRPIEQQNIVDALMLIDHIQKHLYPSELVNAYNEAGYWMDAFMQENIQDSKLFEERQRVLAELANEYEATAKAA